MTNHNENTQTNGFNWQGRDDKEDGELGKRVHHVVTHGAPTTNGVSLVGFESDAGVARNKGRVGAAKAPNLIRQALANMAWHQESTIYDLGNIACHDDQLATAQQALADLITPALNHTPVVVLGGGHEVAWGSFLGLAQHLAQTKATAPTVGIINLDAHFDLRAFESEHTGIQPSSGTPFNQIAHYCAQRQWPFHYACLGVSRASNTQALFRRADELKVLYIEDDKLTPSHLAKHQAALEAFIAKSDVLYLTIDLDVFPAATAPGVSAPAATGVSLDNITPLLQQILSHSDKLKLADIAEYNPDYDIDQHTARLAARLCWEIVEQSTKG